MAKLHFDFVKDAKQGTIELEVFNRLLQGDVYDTEILLMDKPLDYSNGYEYVAVAPEGSLVTDPVWHCVRCSWIDFRKTKMQFRPNIIWTNRQMGWI